MKVAVFSDIHSNIYAFDAVLEHAESIGVDDCWFIGDLFGYGPHALEVLRRARQSFNLDAWVLGNQDAIFAGYLLSGFARQDAVDVIIRNYNEVEKDPELLDWIQKMFDGLSGSEPILMQPNGDKIQIALTHGCLKDPYNLYIYPWTSKSDLEDYMSRPGKQQINWNEHPRVILFGHSHVPALIIKRNGEFRDVPIMEYGREYEMSTECTLINPGSIGQPRDWDDRAAYALLDTENLVVTYYRVDYDVLETAADMQAAHFPQALQRQLLEARGPTPPKEYEAILNNRKELPGG